MPTGQTDPRIDRFIAQLPDWQQIIFSKVRSLIHEAEPEIEETIKRTDRPYFVLQGNICAFQAARDHINILIYDPIVPDPDSIINQGHDNKTAKAIQMYKGQTLNETAFMRMIKAIADNNRAGGWRKLHR